MIIPPNFFSKAPIPDELPVDMQRVIDDLHTLSSKEECLHLADKEVTDRFYGYTLATYLKLWQLWTADVHFLWGKSGGFIHCNAMNYLLRVLLVKSGHFAEEDIKCHWTLAWFISPHQYLRVRIDDAWIEVDPWGRHHGIPIGKHVWACIPPPPPFRNMYKKWAEKNVACSPTLGNAENS